MLPVTGWVAESWLGRYRAIVVGMVLTLATTLTLQAAFVMLQFDWTAIPAFGLVVVGLVIGTFGIENFYTTSQGVPVLKISDPNPIFQIAPLPTHPLRHIAYYNDIHNQNLNIHTVNYNYLFTCGFICV